MFSYFRRSDPSLVEMETENRQLKREIETLKRENAELTESNSKLRRSLASSDNDSELQWKLNRTIEQLRETRQQLLNIQERLTVAEQVTAATQRRELQQEGVYENLPPDSVYQQLRFDATQQPIYQTLQPGCIRFSVAVLFENSSLI